MSSNDYIFYQAYCDIATRQLFIRDPCRCPACYDSYWSKQMRNNEIDPVWLYYKVWTLILGSNVLVGLIIYVLLRYLY